MYLMTSRQVSVDCCPTLVIKYMITKIQSMKIINNYFYLLYAMIVFLQQVVVVYQPLENDAIKCKSEISTVATLAFYNGDEGIRQQYKRLGTSLNLALLGMPCFKFWYYSLICHKPHMFSNIRTCHFPLWNTI